MEEAGSRRKPRPAQRLYVPPAQRNKTITSIKSEDLPEDVQKIPEKINTETPQMDTTKLEQLHIKSDIASNKLTNLLDSNEAAEDLTNSTKDDHLLIPYKSNRTGPDKNELEVDKEKEEMQRAIVNINRKSRPLIKHVNVKNDVLQIDVKNTSNKCNKKSPVKLVQVANWEDLFLEDDQEDSYSTQPEFVSEEESDVESSSDEVNPKMQELEHVIELYDFPSTFKSQDLMHVYSDINKESYIKWCDETHALLVLGSLIQAQKALKLETDIIKSRPMTLAGAIAMEVASKSDLKPAMKRPQTSMHTARRMITTALGAKANISREIQEKEREALRIAKELKRTQKQNERDAWEGNPRPSTA